MTFGAARMSMTSRIALLIAAVLLPALLGSLWIHTATARDALLTQLELRNRDAAAALALSLSQQQGDDAAMQTVAAAQFELGAYRRMSLTAPNGRVLWQREAGPAAGEAAAPAWFQRAWPLAPAAGEARVSQGWQPVGTLRIEAQVAWAQAALWAAVSRTAALLLALGVLALLFTVWALHSWHRPLLATVQQARALEAGRFTVAEEPALPELRTLTRSMNLMVHRMRELFDAQAAQVALLQRQAQTDAVTGLMQRQVFVARLQARLADPASPPIALLLLRLARLQRLNDEIGFEATDRLLATLAEALQAYGERVPGAFAGRLNGGDFALVLPTAGVAAETAASLAQALATLPLARRDAPGFAIGGADGLCGLSGGDALALADAALAEAEVAGEPVIKSEGLRSRDPTGARAWRDQIAAALDAGRTRLAEFAVVDARGRLLHLECPLRVQFSGIADRPDAALDVPDEPPWRPAREWLAQAARSRLLPRVDLVALDLALAAINTDGRPRCVHLAPRSMAEPGFALQVQRRLAALPVAAQQLSLEWDDGDRNRSLAIDRDTLQAAATAWRSFGVRLGVEHAGAAPQRLADWQAVGIDYVKIDSRHLRGVADDDAVRAYATSLVTLIHGLGWTALAEGVDDGRDLAALWALGFDGATGHAVIA